MIVMKFGGTSVADAERIVAVGEIVRRRLERRPVVVVSALAGVTDLLVEAVAQAGAGRREALDRVLAELEKRHRWALAGTISDPGRRHELGLEIDATFEELRQLLRSMRILGEVTPRASDTLLAFGERLSSRIVAASFRERGLAARWVDPVDVMVTDDRHGAARPDLEAVGERGRRTLVPMLDDGEVPVVGGFVGASTSGETTTLGRGGSDTSAAALGAALGAGEIQIWTDVDGLMTADPRCVPAARRLPEVSFSEAAELAHFGARVLHPASIVPAVRRGIPVRILNSLKPSGEGTVIWERAPERATAVASVASRAGVGTLRIVGHGRRLDAGFLARVLGAVAAGGAAPDLVVASEVAVSVVLPEPSCPVEEALGPGVEVERADGRAIVCVVGHGLADTPGSRANVLDALSALAPELLASGGSPTSVAAVVPEADLEHAVRELHRRFFE